MSNMYDVIVVGAGVMGSATAYTLAKRGKKTLLIEQFPQPHSRGSSHGGSRVIRQAYNEQFHADIMSVAFPMWRDLEKETGLVLFRKSGMLVTSVDPKPVQSYNDSLQTYFNKTIPLMDHEELSEKCNPMKIPDGSKGCFDPTAGVLYASKCVAAFQKIFEKKGGKIVDNHKVLDITPGETVTIHTDKGDFKSKGVILTPGSWAPQLLATVGIHLPLVSRVVQVLYWKMKPGADLSALPCFIHFDNSYGSIYGMPPDEYAGLIKILGHTGTPCDPDVRDQTTLEDTRELAVIKEFVAEVFPDVIPEPAIAERCIYTCTPDNVSIIDHHPTYRNIAYGVGFSGRGFKLAPVVGNMLADLVLHQKTSPLLVDEMRASRFNKRSKL